MVPWYGAITKVTKKGIQIQWLKHTADGNWTINKAYAEYTIPIKDIPFIYNPAVPHLTPNTQKHPTYHIDQTTQAILTHQYQAAITRRIWDIILEKEEDKQAKDNLLRWLTNDSGNQAHKIAYTDWIHNIRNRRMDINRTTNSYIQALTHKNNQPNKEMEDIKDTDHKINHTSSMPPTRVDTDTKTLKEKIKRAEDHKKQLEQNTEIRAMVRRAQSTILNTRPIQTETFQHYQYEELQIGDTITMSSPPETEHNTQVSLEEEMKRNEIWIGKIASKTKTHIGVQWMTPEQNTQAHGKWIQADTDEYEITNAKRNMESIMIVNIEWHENQTLGQERYDSLREAGAILRYHGVTHNQKRREDARKAAPKNHPERLQKITQKLNTLKNELEKIILNNINNHPRIDQYLATNQNTQPNPQQHLQKPRSPTQTSHTPEEQEPPEQGFSEPEIETVPLEQNCHMCAQATPLTCPQCHETLCTNHPPCCDPPPRTTPQNKKQKRF